MVHLYGCLLTVDLLAHVFDVLRNDLKSDIAKELFLYYQATPVVLQYLKPVNKVSTIVILSVHENLWSYNITTVLLVKDNSCKNCSLSLGSMWPWHGWMLSLIDLQTFMGSAMDIFLQMSTDSPFQQPFLETCSNETWFRTIAMVLRAPSQDSKLLEKLSIILQKLSKLR